MESRIQRVLVAAALTLACAAPQAAKPGDLELEPMVVREPERREIKVDKIDRENFEIGPYGGLIGVEDFGSDTVYGLRAAYHVSEDFFVEGTYGITELGLTSFERLSGGVLIIPEDEREMTYYNLSVGWNIFPGEAFVTKRWAFKGSLYLIAGAGATEFAGDQRFTVNGGVGYRLITTDWLAFRLDLRDHIFTSDLLGAEKTMHNLELTGGITVFF